MPYTESDFPDVPCPQTTLIEPWDNVDEIARLTSIETGESGSWLSAATHLGNISLIPSYYRDDALTHSFAPNLHTNGDIPRMEVPNGSILELTLLLGNRQEPSPWEQRPGILTKKDTEALGLPLPITPNPNLATFHLLENQKELFRCYARADGHNPLYKELVIDDEVIPSYKETGFLAVPGEATRIAWNTRWTNGRIDTQPIKFERDSAASSEPSLIEVFVESGTVTHRQIIARQTEQTTTALPPANTLPNSPLTSGAPPANRSEIISTKSPLSYKWDKLAAVFRLHITASQ